MVINRRTFNMNKGCMEAAIQLIKDIVAEHPSEKSPRLSTAYFGPFDVLAFEVEFEDLEQYEKYWKDLFARPEMESFFEKWDKLTTTGGANELWEVR